MKALVFDLDGTLVDTKHDMLDAGNLVFESQGWKTRLKGFSGLQTATTRKSNITVWPKKEGLNFDDNLLKDYYGMYLSNYNKVLDNKSVIYDGKTDTLTASINGCKTRSMHKQTRKHARELLKRLGLIDYFKSAFIGSDTVGVGNRP